MARRSKSLLGSLLGSLFKAPKKRRSRKNSRVAPAYSRRYDAFKPKKGAMSWW